MSLLFQSVTNLLQPFGVIHYCGAIDSEHGADIACKTGQQLAYTLPVLEMAHRESERVCNLQPSPRETDPNKS